MLAAILEEPGRFAIRELPLPEPGRGEAQVRLEGCGVCGSNVPAWEGREWFQYPLEPGAPGHEGWGRIDALGEETTGWSVGDRVACLTTHAFAEYDAASATDLVRVPAALADRPFPGEPLACVMNVFRRSGIEREQNVAVVGVGFLGALLTQLAVAAGARVVAISRRSFALKIARCCGASDTVSFNETNETITAARRTIKSDGFDCVIEAVGTQQALDVAAELVRVRGRLVIAGYHACADDGRHRRRSLDLRRRPGPRPGRVECGNSTGWHGRAAFEWATAAGVGTGLCDAGGIFFSSGVDARPLGRRRRRQPLVGRREEYRRLKSRGRQFAVADSRGRSAKPLRQRSRRTDRSAPRRRVFGRLDAEAMHDAYARAAVYALPARYEPFGLTPLEAAFHDCALVLGDIPTLREVWGDAARFVPPDDAAALTAALRELIEDVSVRTAVAARCRRHAERYTAHRMARRYHDLYRQLNVGAAVSPTC